MNTLTLSKRLGRLLRSWFRADTPSRKIDERAAHPRPLRFHNLNGETRKALEDVDNERGVSRARTIAEMIKKLDG